MLHLVECRNVNEALAKGIRLMKMFGREEDSRNGPVLTMPGPVMTCYERPWERVLFSAERDSNPFFALYESLAFLAGENRVAPYANYVKRMMDYSDDGEHLHGAYGFRWREWFGFDQLREIIKHLKEQPNSRRAVLTMWSPNGDLVASEGVGGIHSKDIPCNTQVYFRKRGDALDMTVMARSNDFVWGAYYANACHFSVLLEYMASAVGLKQGMMYQFSNDYHIYRALPNFEAVWNMTPGPQPYEEQKTIPLFAGPGCADEFTKDCERMVAGGFMYSTPFFRWVVRPILSAHNAHREGRDALAVLADMPECDWRQACEQWIIRRARGQA